MKISFLSPRLSPAICGIADHTRLLAEALAGEGVEVGFIHREALPRSARLPEGPVDAWDGSGRGLHECVRRQRPDWLWLQLSSYGYSRWGAPWHLGRALRDLRRAFAELSVAVCAHETHCQPSQLGRKGFLLSPWQRHTVGNVVRLADLVFTSIPKYVHQVVHDYRVPIDRVIQLAIGSNIAPAHYSAEERARLRQGRGWRSDEMVAVTFGSFGSQLRALRGCGESLARGIASGHLQRIVCIGGEGPPPAELLDWAARLGGSDCFLVLGHQPEQVVAEVLACCDFAFGAYPSALLGKSTAFASFALAGLAVLVPENATTESTDSTGMPVLRVSSWDWERTRLAEVELLRQAIRDYAWANLSWTSIARRAVASLKALAGTRGENDRWAVTN